MSIEEEFFKIFGIKKHYTRTNADMVYPTITDRILLELICILNKFNEDVECRTFITGNNIEELKKSIFQECFDINSYIREQVRSLFEGVEE